MQDTAVKASAVGARAHRWHVPRVVVSGRRVSVVISLAILAGTALAAGVAGLTSGVGLALLVVTLLLIVLISTQMTVVPLVDDHLLATVGLAEIDRELARARRFERPFAVARVSFGPGVSPLGVGETIQQIARRFDRYFFDGRHEVLLLMPETPVDLAQRVTERIAAGVLSMGADEVAVGVAGFPGPSASATELLAAAAPVRRVTRQP
jgi:hypothetical protein